MGKSSRCKSFPPGGESKRQGRVNKSAGKASSDQEEEEGEGVSAATFEENPSHGSERVSRKSNTKSSKSRSSKKKSRSKASSSRKASTRRKSSASDVMKTHLEGNVDPPHVSPEVVPPMEHQEECGTATLEADVPLSPSKEVEEHGVSNPQTGRVQRSKSWPRFTGKRKSLDEDEAEVKERDPFFFQEDCVSDGRIDFHRGEADYTFPKLPPRKRTTFEEDWIRARLGADKQANKKTLDFDARSIRALPNPLMEARAFYRGKQKQSRRPKEPTSKSPKSTARSRRTPQPLFLSEVEDIPRKPTIPPPATERITPEAERFPKPSPLCRRAVRPSEEQPVIGEDKTLPASTKGLEATLALTPEKRKRSSYGEERQRTPYPYSKLAHRSRSRTPDLLSDDDEDTESVCSNNPPPPRSSRPQ